MVSSMVGDAKSMIINISFRITNLIPEVIAKIALAGKSGDVKWDLIMSKGKGGLTNLLK